MLNSCHLSALVSSQAKRYGSKVAMTYRDYDRGEWLPITWNEFADKVRKVACALVSCQAAVQENVAVFSQNKPECMFVDFGAYESRVVSIPFYATSSEAQIKYMINDANVRIVFVGEQQQYDTLICVLPVCHSLEHIVIFDRKVVRNERDKLSVYFDEFLELGSSEACQKEVEKRLSEATLTDLANILYTSGTTGDSKGVMLDHEMYYEAIKANHDVLAVTEEDVILNFLPFTHVFERAWSYLCLCEGAQLAVNLRPTDVQMAMREVRPTCMCSVPRFWEKVYAGVMEKIESSSPIQRALMEEALAVGKRYNVDYVIRGLVPPLALRMRYKFFEKTVIGLLKRTLGLERGNFFPTAGAAVPRAIEEFVHSVGINMMVGYGATETTATVTCNHIGRPISVGSVGRFVSGLEFKFGENNEILLRGKTITKGYYNKPALTAQVLDADGWFHTGDAGYAKGNELFLTDRIKDLFKTSNGKYIAPQAIESKLVVDRYIDQISIIADQRKFVSALIVPDYKLLEEYAREEQITFASRRDLCLHPRIIKMVMERIETLQQEFAHYEQIKRITLLSEPFSMDKGELTNTLKIKRPVLYKNYAEQIEAMYKE